MSGLLFSRFTLSRLLWEFANDEIAGPSYLINRKGRQWAHCRPNDRG
jgi:hypothetical protein